MKTIILIIAVLISFGAKAQLSADSVLIPKYIGMEYMLIDTVTNISSGDNDTYMYSETMQKNELPKAFDSIPNPIVPNNDTAYKLVDRYKLDYLYSLKIVRYRLVRKFVIEKVEKPLNLQMSDLAKKRFQLDYDIDLFWNHQKVKALTDEE